MSNYHRVIPRDLFNEAKLLKCMGRLSLMILDGGLPKGIEVYISESGERFDISLLEDGFLYISNYRTLINDIPVIFKTTYNGKGNYPFFCEYEYVDYEVFDEEGNFTEEFKSLKDIIK